MNRLRQFFHSLQKEFLTQPILYSLLILCVVGGAFLRLYKIGDTLMFQGDQGRDALVVAKMFKEADPAFIGPVTSIGNMYLGPFYYYFMLPWLWLSYPSPVGPAVGVALANILAIALFYFCGRQLVGRKAALWASFFFAFSQVAVIYSRFSWNPNLSALFSLLTLFFLHQALTKNTRSWLWVGLSAGLLIQLHYVNLVVIAIVGLFWLAQWWQKGRAKKWRADHHFWRYSLGAVGIFLLTTVPLLLFDWKYDWRNAQAAMNIFTKEESFTSNQQLDTAQVSRATRYQLQNRTRQILGDLALPNWPHNQAFFVFTLLVLLSFFYLTYKKRHTKFALGYQILAVSLVFSILVTGLYRHDFYDHYLLFALPIILLAYGSLLAQIPQRPYRYFINAAIIAIYLCANYQSGFYRANHYLERLNAITDLILQQTDANHTFSFYLLNQDIGLYGEQYQYYLFTKTPHDNFLLTTQAATADQLFVVDESGVADIFANDNFEIRTFLEASASVKTLPYEPENHVKIYQLTRSETTPQATLETVNHE